MKVTLRDIIDSKDYSEFDLLKAKKELLDFKSSGLAFFKEDIALLGLDDEIQLYYFQLPNEYSEVDAFPVPSTNFKCVKCEDETFRHLQEFYEEYYDSSFDKKEFSKYEVQSPYIGNEYVWYYKRTSSFS